MSKEHVRGRSGAVVRGEMFTVRGDTRSVRLLNNKLAGRTQYNNRSLYTQFHSYRLSVCNTVKSPFNIRHVSNYEDNVGFSGNYCFDATVRHTHVGISNQRREGQCLSVVYLPSTLIK